MSELEPETPPPHVRLSYARTFSNMVYTGFGLVAIFGWLATIVRVCQEIWRYVVL